MNIFCDRKQLQRFRKECRKAFPVEHIAALFGLRLQNGDVIISQLEPIICEATPDHIGIEDKNVRKSKIAALRDKKDWLGTIHSHCYVEKDPCCWHLSDTDIETALEYNETVCGLVYVFDEGKKTQAYWYVPSPIPAVKYY